MSLVRVWGAVVVYSDPGSELEGASGELQGSLVTPSPPIDEPPCP